jgi:hypothetical protein
MAGEKCSQKQILTDKKKSIKSNVIGMKMGKDYLIFIRVSSETRIVSHVSFRFVKNPML